MKLPRKEWLVRPPQVLLIVKLGRELHSRRGEDKRLCVHVRGKLLSDGNSPLPKQNRVLRDYFLKRSFYERINYY